MGFVLKSATDRAKGVQAAEEIWSLMDRINRDDTQMAVERTRRHHSEHGEYEEMCPEPCSVYGNLGAALRAVLMGLGVEAEEMDAAWQHLLDGVPMADVISTFGSAS